MYSVSPCPIPDSMRAELVAIASSNPNRLRLAAVWAFQKFIIVGAFFAAIYAIHYVLPQNVAEDIRRCVPKNELPWILLVSLGVGFLIAGAAGSAQRMWVWQSEQARLARLDLESGECDQIDLVLSDRHLAVNDCDEVVLLLVADGGSRTIAFNISEYNERDRRLAVLLDKDKCRTHWSWKRSRNLLGTWEIETSGKLLPLQTAEDPELIFELWPDLPQDGEVLDMSIEQILELSRKPLPAKSRPMQPASEAAQSA